MPEEIVFIGKVRSPLGNIDMCPKMADEGAPEGFVEIGQEYRAALRGIRPGAELIILTWLHLADRDTQEVHPRGNPDNPLTGVFYTRSPARPNPIGLHRVKVLGIDGLTLHVSAIEVVDQTPVIDIKPA
jgi:tRNA-Thr(GGU) m(6)t(6)A37 methyltransferase TsaA